MLISLDTFRNRTDIGTQEGIVTRAKSCIKGAEGYISEYLRTSFVRADNVSEIFSVDPTDSRYAGDLVIALRMGYLETCTVEAYTDFPLEGVDTISPTNYIISHAKGLITVPLPKDTMEGIKYLKITYTAGLELDTNNVYIGVPAAVQEAATLIAEALFMAQCKGKDCVDSRKLGLSHLLDSHIRFFPYAVRSLNE